MLAIVKFADLSIITETGVRFHSGYEGQARIDKHGVVAEILVHGTNSHGVTGLLRIDPEDGQIYEDIYRGLVSDYSHEISEAAETAYFQARQRAVA